uniref:Acylphosphatase n=1 Tax=Gadus morhua TaxID=8049 RepID=A0A8C5B702_GADMO
LKPYPLGKINLRCCFPRFTLRLNVHTMSCEDLLSVDYEVFGRVQGVFFRKFTQAEAKKLGLVGWVRNTEAGTVEGQLQGPGSKVNMIFSLEYLFIFPPLKCTSLFNKNY